MSDIIEKVKKRSGFKGLQLRLLLQVTKAINENYSREELYSIYQEILCNNLNIGKIALYNREADWVCAICRGVSKEKLTIDIERDLVGITKITRISILNKKISFEPFDIIIPVFHKEHPLSYLFIGDFEKDPIAMSPTIKHLPYIQTLTNIISVAIENKKFAKEQIRQEGIRRELELAREMQSLLFPKKLPDDEKLEMAAFFQPHQEVGGDYYDFMRLNENEVSFCMADVSGKGVSAAFLMANFQAYIRSIELYAQTSSLTDLVQKLNERVMDSARGEKYITLFIAKYNLFTRTLTYINAGHNPPLFVSANNTTLLKLGCTGLGMFENLPSVSEGIITVDKNSIIVCYTDGVVEIEDDNKEEFGIERLTDIVLEAKNKSMESLNKTILQALSGHKRNSPYSDDFALLSCRFL